jgi:hypothetical protein
MTKRFWWLSLASLFFLGCDGTSPTSDAGPGVDGEVAECAGGSELCGNTCVDVSSDRANCGACGSACGAGEVCVDGACGVGCPASQVLCGGACIDTTTDRRHCGACDAACADGEICVGGSCEISCPAGQTVCDGACASTDSDPAHCGGCGLACAAGEVCSEGACVAECGAGLMECSAACVDTMNSPDHCGACDATCATTAADASGLCIGGSCRAVCDALYADCNADLASATTDGCETPLATDPINCGACNRRCSLVNARPGCDMGECVVATCAPGFGNCDANEGNGCEARLYDDDANCGACGNVCAGTESCIAGACATVAGDNCLAPIALSRGANTVRWTAPTEDYLTLTPSCSSDAPTGGDVVMSYTAGATAEHVTISIRKPEDNVWTGVLSTAACGTVAETACLVEDLAPAMAGSVELAAGQTVYLYLSDTADGDFELPNPLDVTVAAIDCAANPPPSVVELTPANGSVTRVDPVFRVQFDGEIATATGTVTITGNMGTSLSYDLSTSPSQVAFYGGGTLMQIEPGMTFPQGESLTVSWTGLVGAACAGGGAATAPTWAVTVTTPSCTPGMGGMVGTTTARIAGTASTTEYFVAPDEDPEGWVYMGSTTELVRVPKRGGAAEDIETLAGLTSSNLGYTMVISGSNIYTVESKTSGTTGHIFRISTDGGISWLVEDYATFPTAPNDDFRAATVYEGRIYLATADAAATQVWSMPAAATTLPVTAVLELTLPGLEDCNGLTRDSTFYYLACSVGDRLWRVPAYGADPVVLSDDFDMSSTVSAVFGSDLDGDSVFDVLYLQTWYEEVHYICDPATAAPFSADLVDVGGASSNYGMGFDRSANALWMFDDDTPEEFISIR